MLNVIKTEAVGLGRTYIGKQDKIEPRLKRAANTAAAAADAACCPGKNEISVIASQGKVRNECRYV